MSRRYCFAECVERARTNVAIDNPERSKSQGPELLARVPVPGALLLAAPEALENPFYRLYPDWALIPMW